MSKVNPIAQMLCDHTKDHTDAGDTVFAYFCGSWMPVETCNMTKEEGGHVVNIIDAFGAYHCVDPSEIKAWKA